MELLHDLPFVGQDESRDRDTYTHPREAIESLRVVSDQSERGVALIHEKSGR